MLTRNMRGDRRLVGSVRLALAVAFCLWVATALAATAFPQLSGRVVDDAGVIPADTRAKLDGTLKDLEDKSGIQLVVATVKSLDGNDVETYANELFRAWKIGEEKKNNGVLLLVAPADHKVRIEVGYGLEGTLTDALSKIIIANGVAPRFKAGDYGGGIERGVQDIIATLSSDSDEWSPRPQLRAQEEGSTLDALFPFVLLGVVMLVLFLIQRNAGPPGSGRLVGRGGSPIFIPSWGGSSGGGSGGFSGFGGGGGSDGGGFSGGGGSSGGGGASGSW